MERRVIRLIGWSDAATLVAALAAAPSAGAADRLPDLGMARLGDLKVDKAGGRRLLHYTTVIVNVGAGPFEAVGQRTNNSEPEMSVKQRIYDDGADPREVTTPATMFFAGDGHSHWHIRDLETSELVRLDNGNEYRPATKTAWSHPTRNP